MLLMACLDLHPLPPSLSPSPPSLPLSPPPPPAKLTRGEKLHGYTVESVSAVPDFDLVAVKLRHDVTGAQHLHLARKDSNNVFRYQ